jgi:hypothetical protein
MEDRLLCGTVGGGGATKDLPLLSERLEGDADGCWKSRLRMGGDCGRLGGTVPSDFREFLRDSTHDDILEIWEMRLSCQIASVDGFPAAFRATLPYGSIGGRAPAESYFSWGM